MLSLPSSDLGLCILMPVLSSEMPLVSMVFDIFASLLELAWLWGWLVSEVFHVLDLHV